MVVLLEYLLSTKKDTDKVISSNVKAMLEKEFKAGITTPEYYLNFQERVDNIKYQALSFLIEQKKEKKESNSLWSSSQRKHTA